jgi:hypothetical protein
VNPAWWFAAWFVSVMLAGGFGAWAIWPTAERHGREDASYEAMADDRRRVKVSGRHPSGRHRHEPLPVATRLELPSPMTPEQKRAGEEYLGRFPVSDAEYELLTAPMPVHAPGGFTPPRPRPSAEFSVTAWTDAMAADMDRWLGEHVRSVDLNRWAT